MERKHNFNPGPAVLPEEVLLEAREEFLDYKGTGISIFETSHRSGEYQEINDRARSLVLELLGLPEGEFDAMFLQGGASLQFAMVPMNFLKQGEGADYIVTGAWSEKALKEARLQGNVNVAADTKEGGRYRRIPGQGELRLNNDSVYVHITTNNTIAGTQWQEFPETGGVPIVADMSSDILWKEHDLSGVGMIYAGAQKNLGPAGATLVVIRKDLLQRSREDIPIILRYKTHSEKKGLYNTPSCFAVYMVLKVLEWMKRIGGAKALEKRNREKAGLLYGVLDKYPGFYDTPVERESRPYMHVVWRLKTEELEKEFLEESSKNGMVGLKGHRSVGGLRASLYNSLPLSSVKALAAFMEDFAQRKG